MNEEKMQLIRLFINAYKEAKNKEAFIAMWDSLIPTDFNNHMEEVPLTLRDAYDNAYGNALAQL